MHVRVPYPLELTCGVSCDAQRLKGWLAARVHSDCPRHVTDAILFLRPHVLEQEAGSNYANGGGW